MLPKVTVQGRLTRPPELRFIPSGAAVASFTVAASERKKNQAGEWADGDKCFLRCSLWEGVAENVAEGDLQQGAEVLVTGDLFQREYETNDGEKRQSVELKNCTFAVVVSRGQQVMARKVQRNDGQGGGGGFQGQPQGQGFTGQPQGQQGGGWQQQGGGQQGAAAANWQQGMQGGGQDPWVQQTQGQPQGQTNAPTQGPWTGQGQNAANGYADEPPW